jgi:hypothetical protein
MPGEAMIQAAIQTLLQDTALYSMADVTLGDQRVMGRGRQCAVIYPGSFEASRPGDWSQVTVSIPRSEFGLFGRLADHARPLAGIGRFQFLDRNSVSSD